MASTEIVGSSAGGYMGLSVSSSSSAKVMRKRC
jgi:hypothetical protein